MRMQLVSKAGIRVNGCETIEDLFEVLYVAGLHDELSFIAQKMGKAEALESIRKSYLFEGSEYGRNRRDLGSDDDLGELIGLGGFEHAELKAMAAGLPEGSKVLEIGTYIGKSTLALAQGCETSHSTLTCIDLYVGFDSQHSRNTVDASSSRHWEYAEWQKNVSKYSPLISSFSGKSLPILRELIADSQHFNLIFLDSAHGVETHAELALCSCLAAHGCQLVLDDVISYGSDMTTAWLVALGNYLAFPRFTKSGLAVCGFRNSSMPLNYKADPSRFYSNVTDFVSRIESFDASKGLGFSFEDEVLWIFELQ